MSYRKSSVYQIGYQLALNCEEICRRLPSHERYALAQQLRNSSRSIVANYVEGYIRQGLLSKDHRRFLVYSQGSCDETKYWLELGKDMGLISDSDFKSVFSGYVKLSRALVSMIRQVVAS
jgi:four helix bundle protein